MSAALPLGANVPDLTALDPASGDPVRLVKPGRATFITFLRGTWCPTCRHFLDQVTPIHGEIAREGVDVVAVACQGRHWVTSWLAVNPLPFPLLVDEDRALAKAFGVYKLLGLDGVNIARPATFLVNPRGVIVWEHVGAHAMDRPNNATLLDLARRAPTALAAV